MKIKITSDSTCDLSDGLIEKNGIGIFSLSVILGEDSYKDGEIAPSDIFDYVAKSNRLPKTAAGTIEAYSEFFDKNLKGGDALIHFNISSQASSSHSAASKAAEEFGGKVIVIDSRALSTGQGLLALKACDLVREGLSAAEIAEKVNALRPLVNTSFVPDALDYLHKGGRCSLAALIGAKVMKLHPMICENNDGRLIAKKKYMGGMSRCIKNYISDLKSQYPAYDKTRCFITHSSADKELVDLAKQLVSESFSFDEVIETVAGSIVTSHCGRNTLGVLFISE
ncbi:MAG: DegV family protein [Clostridia bacterium]|nr:DegV family protein [Clostridia bacterium]